MEVRPKLKIALTVTDRVLEALCFALLILLWVGTIAFYSKLPEQIPSHYNATGIADDYSNKSTIFVLPVLAAVIYLAMTVLSKHPHIFNYPATITQENAKRMYTTATRLIRVMKLVVIVILGAIVFMTFRTSLSKREGLGSWFLPVAVVVMIAPVVFYLMKSRRSEQD